ncbi:hypothetical protein Rsub_06753 [Raphidocelis subcapitata]|uniref:GATA-type domain-containing protein n=1 Tax=Raphidocelis subcapitata TaxID=307507 RepID=A0A2V0P724_9CHLO|nr:hypothetical protein Rsub_06753 [Raphidocelis subcapitata]|eukprot:GBF93650.1 hypothetical protein Rsub_06753 [Raphidocelis subcapitata]
MPCFALELELEAAQMDASRVACDMVLVPEPLWQAPCGKAGAHGDAARADKAPAGPPLKGAGPAAEQAAGACAAQVVHLRRQPAVRTQRGLMRRCLPGVQQYAPAPAPAAAAASPPSPPEAAASPGSDCAQLPGSNASSATCGAPLRADALAAWGEDACGPAACFGAGAYLDVTGGAEALAIGGPSSFVRHDDGDDDDDGASFLGFAADGAEARGFDAIAQRAPWWASPAADELSAGSAAGGAAASASVAAASVPLPPGCSLPGRTSLAVGALPLACSSPLSPSPLPCWRSEPRRQLALPPMQLGILKPPADLAAGALLAGAFPPTPQPADAAPKGDDDDAEQQPLLQQPQHHQQQQRRTRKAAPVDAAGDAAALPPAEGLPAGAAGRPEGAVVARRVPPSRARPAPPPPGDSSDGSDAGDSPLSRKRPAARLLTRPPGAGCVECGATSTPVWRSGPKGPKSLCNRCGVRLSKMMRRK